MRCGQHGSPPGGPWRGCEVGKSVPPRKGAARPGRRQRPQGRDDCPEGCGQQDGGRYRARRAEPCRADAGATKSGDGTRLVIVESPAKARTIAGYLGTGTWSSPASATSATCRTGPPRSRPSTARSRGPASGSTSTTTSRRSTSSRTTSASRSPSSRTCSRTPTNSCSPPMRTARARPSPGTCSRSSSPRSRTTGWSSTRSPRKPSRQAVANPRELDQALVDAYQARRVLDRLYGYEVSPVLWKKVMPRLSAGRVQSVATRLVVDRERERIAFRAAQYWDLEAEFATIGETAGRRHGDARARLVRRHAGHAWTARAWPRAATSTRSAAEGAARTCCTWTGRPRPRWPGACRTPPSRSAPSSASPSSGPRTRRSAPPRCSRRPRASWASPPSTTMSVAQRLYENGYITYMRTDSTTLSQTAIDAARAQARELYGDAYVPDAPRVYASKVKNAQEAHEAIRPSGDRFRTPEQVARDGVSRRRAAAVRPGVEAHRRLPDEGRDRRVRLGARRRDVLGRGERRVRRVRQRYQVLRLPQGLRRGRGRPERRPRRP